MYDPFCAKCAKKDDSVRTCDQELISRSDAAKNWVVRYLELTTNKGSFSRLKVQLYKLTSRRLLTSEIGIGVGNGFSGSSKNSSRSFHAVSFPDFRFVGQEEIVATQSTATLETLFTFQFRNPPYLCGIIFKYKK